MIKYKFLKDCLAWISLVPLYFLHFISPAKADELAGRVCFWLFEVK
jgi:hypothetical protein